MFYIIETQEQLKKFKTYDLTDSFVEFITNDDRMHPMLSDVSLVYIKPSRSRTGFILPIDHSECFSLPLHTVLDLISSKVKNISVFDAKKAKYCLGDDVRVKDLKMIRFLDEGIEVEDSSYNTVAHNFLYNKYPYRTDINKLIPVSKHQEKWNNLVKDLKPGPDKKYHSFYCNDVNDAFRSVERNGIFCDNDVLNEHYTLKNEAMSLGNSSIYSKYNLYTATGRPSNAFNGINFGAMNKGDSSRAFIVPFNNRLIEMDYSAYHPRILAKLLDYTFEDQDIYSHLGKVYYDVDELTDEQYEEAKTLTFKYMYTRQGAGKGIKFVDSAMELTDYLWSMYQKKGYIPSPLTKKPIRGITSKTQVLPFLLQTYETERNVGVINNITKLLDGKQSNIVMYSYDAILFDYRTTEGEKLLLSIKDCMEEGGFPVAMSHGKNYASMRSFTL